MLLRKGKEKEEEKAKRRRRKEGGDQSRNRIPCLVVHLLVASILNLCCRTQVRKSRLDLPRSH
jgi:hypothetical protein